MKGDLIFWPVVVMVLLTLLVYVRLIQVKIHAIKAGKVNRERQPLHGDAWPDSVLQINNNIRNQFELPVLFYVVCFVLWALEAVGVVALVIAWLFVPNRRRAFTAGWWILAADALAACREDLDVALSGRRRPGRLTDCRLTPVGPRRIAALAMQPIASIMRLAWLAAAALLLIACATKTMPSSSAKPIPAERILAPEFAQPRDGLAFLVVTRDTGTRGMLCDVNVFIDGVRAAELRPGEQARLYVEEGKHLIGVTTEGCLGGEDQTAIEATRARPFLLRIRAGGGDGIQIEPSAF